MAGAILESVGLILGSLAAALLLCGLLWWSFRLIGHPGWAGPFTLLLIPLAFVLPGMPFVDMAVIFTLLFAIPLWIEGRRGSVHHG
ncbi:energy-converting hydrogenase Eha subunit B [Sphingomonas naasensis]|uniref:Uncharacterized protein n=1 Tax=Sphingomonas naasensis TaxID=1344951 RepID=A0A4S1WDD0_9SPHN|nr:hypothetical protein [Sphingomonas naasensis]NIJ19812.1 energy-converting hydrogenase Eha subunit B [Sphingomonas naasensis]TGX40055.1 hypothetical protein E5A74_15900 [Sphingomonas naasensis]